MGCGSVYRKLCLFGPVMQKLHERLRAQNLWTLFLKLETVLCTTLALMELRGLSVNTNMMRNFSSVLQVFLNCFLNFRDFLMLVKQ